jgi:hypothetical protein
VFVVFGVEDIAAYQLLGHQQANKEEEEDLEDHPASTKDDDDGNVIDSVV